VLSNLYDDDSDVTKTMKQMFQIGGAMYSTAIHFLVAQELLGDPPAYAERLIDTCEVGKNFKKKPNIGALKQMLTDACVHKTTAGPSTSESPSKSARKNLPRDLQSLDKPETCLPPTGRKRKRFQMPSFPESSEDELVLEDILETFRGRGKGKGKKKM
jgi:hypothetical protein